MKLSNLHKAFLTIALINAGDGITTTILPLYLKDSGQTVETIGLVFSVFPVLSLISRMPAGMMYKPRSADTVMRLFGLIYALSLLFYSVFSDVAGITVLRAIGGFTFGVVTTLNMAVLMDVLSSTSDRARAMAFYAAAMSAGFALGNLAGGWLVDTTGYHWAFRLAAISPAIAALISITTADTIQVITQAQVQRLSWLSRMQSGLRYAWSGPVLVIAMLAFSLNANHYLANTFFPLYATGVGLSMTSIGLLRGLHSFCGTVTRPFSGEATRFASHDFLANAGLVLVAMLIALIPSFSSMEALIPLFLVLGTGRGIVMVSNTISLAELAGDDVRKRGILSGIFNTAKDMGNIFGPIFGGVLAGYAGIENMLRIGPLALVVVYLVAFGTVVRRRAAQPQVEAVKAEDNY